MTEEPALYWTTSNPSPDFDGGVSPGDDLYTDCVLALDMETGKLKWHSIPPHDLFDYDATETPILIDTVYRRAAQAPGAEWEQVRYVDRTNGKFLSAVPFVKSHVGEGVDAQGRPVVSGLKPAPEGTRICPATAAPPWFAPPITSLPFCLFLALEMPDVFLQTQKFEEGKTSIRQKSNAFGRSFA
jgi:alcohol dehydrogenase (cytochrome c)